MELQPIKMRFYPKRKAPNTNIHVLYMRLLMSGKRTEICLNYELTRDAWDFRDQGMKMKHPDYAYVLNLTNQYRANALMVYQQMIQRGMECDVFVIREKLTGNSEGSMSITPTLLGICEKVINRKKILSGRKNSKATVQKYNRLMTHLKQFLEHQYHKKDIVFNKIDLEFIENLEVYLRTIGRCGHNTSMKHIQTFKTIYKHALAHGWAEKDPFQKFKITLQEVERDYLTEQELKAMIDLEAPTDTLAQIRDMFVFSCFTGLAYIDLRNLSAKKIVRENGKYWIRTRREKTFTKSNIPLLEIPLHIIRKYKPDFETADPDERLFRIISNQKYNEHLKNLATVCGIKKNLTTHIARHTFATTVTLSNGVPIESVSAMMGHKHIPTTQHYAKLLDKRLEHDMLKLNSVLSF